MSKQVKPYMLFVGTIPLSNEQHEEGWVLVKTARYGIDRIQDLLEFANEEYPWGNLFKVSLKDREDKLLFVYDEEADVVKYAEGNPLSVFIPKRLGTELLMKKELVITPQPKRLDIRKIDSLTEDCFNG